MTEKAYRLGFLVGRFQIIHAGHEEIIRRAVELCERTAVFVGSSQESGTAKNPFSYELRAEMLTDIFGNDISVWPLPDLGVGNNGIWGRYVLQNVYERTGAQPDLFISGEEERRTSWFTPDMCPGLSELIVPKTIDISASRMRGFILEDRREEWKAYTSPVLWSRYETLRETILRYADVSHTASM